MASYEEFQSKVDDLTFKVEDLLRWAQGLTDVAQSGEIGALAFVQSLAAAPVGNQETARGNLGLGAAATRGVTGGAGALMAQGAFGLGGNAASGVYDSEAGFGASGFLWDPNQTEVGNNSWPLLHVARSDGIWWTLGGYISNNEPAVEIKARSSGGVSPTRRLFHNGNVLGAVSQSVGVPTGAIIERGSNSNGDYALFADGTVLMTAALTNINVSEASGHIFISDSHIWDYPYSGVIGPRVAGGTNSTRCWLALNVIGSRTNFSVCSSTAITGRSASLLCIGRWY